MWDSTALLREKGGSEPADANVGREKEAFPAAKNHQANFHRQTWFGLGGTITISEMIECL